MPSKEEKESGGVFGGSKKIMVDQCLHCPLRRLRGSVLAQTERQVCTHPNTNGWELEILTVIPLWCNLEDE